MGAKIGANDNTGIVGELWNTRSSVSLFFDMLDVPVAIYEYRKDKLELLRSNSKYDTVIGLEGELDESERDRRMEEERLILQEAFEKLAVGDFCEPMEYEISDDIWYRLTAKMVGKREDTMIMMVTYNDISNYK